MATAAVIADDCMTADAVATAVMVLGSTKGKALCEELGLEMFVIERDAEAPLDAAKFVRTSTVNFPFVELKKKVNAKKRSLRSQVQF